MPLHVVFGAGPAGLATVHSLLGRGLSVRVITRSSVPQLPLGVQLMHGDAADLDFSARACQGADVVYQTLNAPYHKWSEAFPPLQRGVMHGATLAGARLVSLENLYGYGRVSGAMTEEHPDDPCSVKGRVRAAMTRELLAAHEAGQLDVTIGRASDFFGPGVLQSALGERVLGRLCAGQSAQVLGDADKLHTYSYMPDVGEALVVLGTRPEALGRVWHLPSPPTTTTRDVIGQLAACLDVDAKISATPKWVLWMLSWLDAEVGAVMEMTYQFEADFVMSDEQFRSTFGVHPTPLPEAVRETASWYKERAVS